MMILTKEANMWVLEIYDLATDAMVGCEVSNDIKAIEKIIEKYKDDPTVDFYIYNNKEPLVGYEK
jgi:hypothetical protein